MIRIDFNPKNEQLAQFGWISLIGFPLVGLVISYNFLETTFGTLFWTLLVVGVVTFALSRANPRLIVPVYVGMMVVAAPIGLVISFTIVALIYYLMVTPLGLLFRLFGRDTLHRRPDRGATSYWHVREVQPPPASYLKQY